jgi:hypothetical protein
VSFFRLNGWASVLVPSKFQVDAAIIPPAQSKLPTSRFRFSSDEML